MRAIVMGGLFVLLAGFSPGSSCAKACRQGGKSADEVAHVAPRMTPHVPTHVPGRGVVIPPGGVGHVADDVAHLTPSSLDEAVAALPEPDGGIAKLATKPTADGTIIRIDSSGRSFGRDYARSVDDLGLEAAQHEELIDAFEIAQDVAGEVLEALITDDDSDPDAVIASETARRRLRDAAATLDIRLQQILDRAQYLDLAATLGSAEVIAYRLGREKPIGQAPARKSKDR